MRVVAGVSLLFFAAEVGFGLVLHPDGEPNLASWTARPYDDVVGRWGNNASCVAVSRNSVITTRHQGGGTEKIVTIGGQAYEIEQIWNHSSADLRLAKLRNANLIHFVDVYAGAGEVGLEIVLGGFGWGRGAALQAMGKTYGYEWLSSGNAMQRWCTNIVEADSIGASGGFSSHVIIADFDGTGEGESSVYEGIPAMYDSGGGWFVYDTDRWMVAGLTRAVSVHYEPGHEGDPAYQLYESWFRDRAMPNKPLPDYMDAVRVGSYANWIMQTIPPVAEGDLTGDDAVNLSDYGVLADYWLNSECGYDDNWCGGSDFDLSGTVDWIDMEHLSARWLWGTE